MDIKSAAIYGNDHTVTTMVAANASNSSIFFESFENGSDIPAITLSLEDNYSITQDAMGYTYGNYGNWSITEAHSGNKSYEVGFVYDIYTPPYGMKSQLSLKTIELTDQIKNNGLLIKFWVKRAKIELEFASVMFKIPHSTNPGYNIEVECEKVARVGEW